jgi:hypothetical protein
MPRALAPFSKLESSNHTQSSADFITNTSGFSFRYTQASLRLVNEELVQNRWCELAPAATAMERYTSRIPSLHKSCN